MPRRAWIVAALGNEAPYLLEWIAHYRGLGFDGAILFTADAQDGTDRLVARLQDMGLARHVELTLKPGQNPLRQGLRELPDIVASHLSDWFFVADIEEYLVVRTDEGDLQSLLNATGEVDAISVCRKPFGSMGRRGIPGGSLRETYRMAAREDDRGKMMTRGIKTLFRGDRVSRMGPHRPYFEDVPGPVTWLDGGGRPMPEMFLDGKWSAHDGFSHDLARLHYHPVPSPETFLIRRGLPEEAADHRALKGEWKKLNINDAEDRGADRSIALSSPELDRLRADPTLAELDAAGRAWHAARAEAITWDASIAGLCDKLASLSIAAPGAPAAPAADKADAVVRSTPRGGGGLYAPPPVRPIRFKIKPSKTGEIRAVLHGGFHKTATTYLQRMLEDNDEWLGKKSVYVVPHLKLRKHITFPSQLDAYRHLKVKRRTKFSEEELQSFSDAFFAEPLALKPARMILSDENIPGLPAHCVTTGVLYQYRKEFFRAFAKRLPLPVTEAYFAVRNYADFFASSYVEYLRAATTTTRGQMITPEEMRRNVFASLPNWQKVFEDFSEVFPEARLHIWRFEDFRALTPRVLELFCGEGVDVDKLAPPKERNARPSASARAVEELVLISELEGAAAMADRAKDVQAMYPQGTEHGRFDPWTEAERAHLLALYDQDWAALCADERIVTLEAPE